MVGAEERKLGYLFKLKQSANVKKLIGQIFRKEEWEEAGQQWQGREDVLRLSGWSQARRVVVLRRPLRSKPAAEAETVGQKKSKRKGAKQLTLDLPELTYQGTQYEYAVLVTSLKDEVRSVAQLYRDRGDAENNFDELKNQWGWAGLLKGRAAGSTFGRTIALEISSRNSRVAALQERWDCLRAGLDVILDQRGADMADLRGGASGLLMRDCKGKELLFRAQSHRLPVGGLAALGGVHEGEDFQSFRAGDRRLARLEELNDLGRE
jgi:Transposase DDE domain